VETGISKEQLLAAKKKFDEIASDPAKLKILVLIVLFVAGFFGLCLPQAKRLAEARTAYADAKEQATTAEQVKHFVKQTKIYEGDLPGVVDLGSRRTEARATHLL